MHCIYDFNFNFDKSASAENAAQHKSCANNANGGMFLLRLYDYMERAVLELFKLYIQYAT